jgi:hypothetical protein
VGFYEPQEKTQEDNIYSISEKLAEYPGGIASMQNFINQRKVYPAEERQNGIQGTVIITFQISKRTKGRPWPRKGSHKSCKFHAYVDSRHYGLRA